MKTTARIAADIALALVFGGAIAGAALLISRFIQSSIVHP